MRCPSPIAAPAPPATTTPTEAVWRAWACPTPRLLPQRGSLPGVLRTHWDELSGGVRDAIESRVGSVISAETAAEGLNSALALVLRSDTGAVFVKGLRADHPGSAAQLREAMINPYVLDVAPELLWRIEIEGWHVLAFDHVDGRHADYAPGSADLPKVVAAMDVLTKLPCPDLPLKQAEQRWANYVDDASARDLLRGDSLLHTDFNPLNILINDGSTYIIDWAWPTRGAAWIDPACLILRLMAAGHTAAEAESWAARTVAWATAPRAGITVFADANRRMWREIARNDPQPWKQRMATAADAWADYVS